jgi:hypothetical protein
MENNKFLERKEIIENPKYTDLYSVFESIFIKHGYNSSDYFDREIWFIKEDKEFFETLWMSTPGETPTCESHVLLEILANLNEIDKKDIYKKRQIRVQVYKFIYTLCEGLLLHAKTISISSKLISSDSIRDKLAICNKKIGILAKTKSNDKILTSLLEVSLSKFSGFEEGVYDVAMKIVEFEQLNQRINSKTQILMLNNQVDINRSDFASNFQFNSHEFKVFDTTHEYPDVNFSGTSISYLKLDVTCKGGITLESEPIFFFNLIQDNLEELCSKDDDISNKIYFKFDDKILISGLTKLRLDNLTRKAMIERATVFYSGIVDSLEMTKQKWHEYLDYICNDFYKQTIEHILLKPTEDKRESCCGCFIF